ncbi:HPr(Ser) kinase/phosphatase [bacterium]|nr:HPr(Ser) kinase/phosphatase [bacterium]
MAFVRVRELVAPAAENLELKPLTDEIGLGNKIGVPHVQNPGLALAGYTRHIVPQRVQVFDRAEIDYLERMDPETARTNLNEFFGKGVCVCVLTAGMEAPKLILELARESRTPVLRTKRSTHDFTEKLTHFLENRFARRTTLHGVLMDVSGVGVLLLGKSAIGKSECALDLVLKGHRLVADDIVELQRVDPDAIYGRGSDITKYYMEIRGLGIINVKEMFGIGAIRDLKKVHLVVKFVEWTDAVEYERIGLDEQSYQILGVEMPMVTLPVRPGRNMTAIVEVAARNHLLKMEGYNAAQSFQASLLERISLGAVDDDTGDGE